VTSTGPFLTTGSGRTDCPKFGLVNVQRETMTRVPRASYHLYKEVSPTPTLPRATPTPPRAQPGRSLQCPCGCPGWDSAPHCVSVEVQALSAPSLCASCL